MSRHVRIHAPIYRKLFDPNKTLTNSNVTEVRGTDNKVVTINFTTSDALQDLEFYFPIPVNTYPELNISVAGDNKNTLSIKTFRGDDGK